MRLKFLIGCVAVFVIGCSSSEEPVHTHEPIAPQESYEPADFETVSPDK